MTPVMLPEKCTEPLTLALNCSSSSTVERYYFDGVQCISFQACNTDPDNVTTFETEEACQTACQGLITLWMFSCCIFVVIFLVSVIIYNKICANY